MEKRPQLATPATTPELLKNHRKFEMQRPHGILEDLGAEIGFTATTALVAWFGGANLYVPSEVDPDHLLARTIGMPAFRRLVMQWGGETLWIPINHAYEIDRRSREAANLLARGMGSKAVSQALGISERRVQQLRAKLEENGMLPYIMRSIPEIPGKSLFDNPAGNSSENAGEKPGQKLQGKAGGKTGGKNASGLPDGNFQMDVDRVFDEWEARRGADGSEGGR